MSCFESSKFLRNPQVMNQEVLVRACDKLGWKYEIKKGAIRLPFLFAILNL